MKILSKRLKNYLFEACSGSFLELYDNVVDQWERFNEGEAKRIMLSMSALQCCPGKIQATSDGLGVKINEFNNMDMFTIAVSDEVDPTQTAIKYSADLHAIDKMYEIAKEKSVDFTVTQIIYKPSNEEINKENKREKKKIQTARKVELKQSGDSSEVYDWQEDDLRSFFSQSYKGEHAILKQLVLAGVSAPSEDDAAYTITETQTEFKSAGINTDSCYGGQMRALKALIPSNEIMKEHMITVLSNTAAAFWPGRTPIKTRKEFTLDIWMKEKILESLSSGTLITQL